VADKIVFWGLGAQRAKVRLSQQHFPEQGQILGVLNADPSINYRLGYWVAKAPAPLVQHTRDLASQSTVPSEHAPHTRRVVADDIAEEDMRTRLHGNGHHYVGLREQLFELRHEMAVDTCHIDQLTLQRQFVHRHLCQHDQQLVAEGPVVVDVHAYLPRRQVVRYRLDAPFGQLDQARWKRRSRLSGTGNRDEDHRHNRRRNPPERL